MKALLYITLACVIILQAVILDTIIADRHKSSVYPRYTLQSTIDDPDTAFVYWDHGNEYIIIQRPHASVDSVDEDNQ